MQPTESRKIEIDGNPYRPPQSVLSVTSSATYRRLNGTLPKLLLIQAAVIVFALVAENQEHESIVFSGPVFALVGLAIAITAGRGRDILSALYGGSAVAFAALIVFLINYNRWSPIQGDRPITTLAYWYTGLAAVVTLWLLFFRRVPREP